MTTAGEPATAPSPVDPVPGRDWRNAVAVVIVVAVMVIGLILISLAHWRRGSVMLGGAVLLAGVLRLVLSEERIGPLAVRGKTFDVTFSFLIAAGLAAVAIGVGVDPVS